MKSISQHKIILVLVFIIVSTACCISYAQQDSQYTQYMYNTIMINPAYAGNREVLTINSLYRNQWVGIEGAPETITASINTPIGVSGVGLGLSFLNDKIGPSNETLANVDFSYSIPTGNNSQLAFGLKAGVNILDVNFSNLIFDPLDPNAQNINSQISPTVGIGTYYNTDRFYLGLSAPNLLRTDHYDEFTSSVATEEIHVYLISGYVFDLSPSTQFKPAVLFKAVNGAPLAVDMSLNFLFSEKFTLGAAYRLNAAVSGLAGFQFTDRWMIGYAYDFNTTEIRDYSYGSHEVFLRYELFTRSRNAVNPRFF